MMVRLGSSGPTVGRHAPPQWLPPPPPPGDSTSCDTNRDDLSSQDSSSYRGIPAYWRRQASGGHGHHHHHHTNSQPSDGLASPVYQSPFPEEQRLYYEPASQILGQSSSLPRGIIGGATTAGPVHSPPSPLALAHNTGAPPSPGPLPPGLHGCGGHCVAFESFCHYCLQVSFVAGILTGVSLCIAGGVLRGGRGGSGDLLVLVYIGALSALVSSLLLAVQCCVRRQVEARKRALSRPRGLLGNPSQHIQMSTLQRAGPPPITIQAPGVSAGPQLQPLLARLVQQQSREPLLQQNQHGIIQQHSSRDWEHNNYNNTIPRQHGGTGMIVAPHQNHHYTSTMLNSNRISSDNYRSNQIPMEDHNGLPWWRRDGLNETRH